MKTFSIVCIVVGSVCLLAFVAAQEPPVSSLEDVVGLGIITSIFLIALGIVGVATAKKTPAYSSTSYPSPAMPVSNIPTPPPRTVFCVSCGNQLAAGTAFCTACGKAM